MRRIYEGLNLSNSGSFTRGKKKIKKYCHDIEFDFDLIKTYAPIW